jgi:hypothetical protein
MNGLPSRDLQEKAADDRRRLHTSVQELRSHLRDTLDLQKNTREHLGLICAGAALVAVTAGYAFTGIFTD